MAICTRELLLQRAFFLFFIFRQSFSPSSRGPPNHEHREKTTKNNLIFHPYMQTAAGAVILAAQCFVFPPFLKYLLFVFERQRVVCFIFGIHFKVLMRSCSTPVKKTLSNVHECISILSCLGFACFFGGVRRRALLNKKKGSFVAMNHTPITSSVTF